MRPFRLGRCVLPLASRSQCCQHQKAFYDIRCFSSTGLLSEDSVDAQVKRKRGRPRKDDGSMLQSNVAAVTSSTSTSADSASLSPSIITSSPPSPTSTFSQSGAASPPFSIALEDIPSPPPSASTSSAKLSALHSRLHLPDRLPLQTLARTLVHSTADPDTRFNNSTFATLGNDLLGFYMAEHLLTKYPRLPMAVLFAAQMAYVHPKALSSIVESWGVEIAAEPGGEVDPGLLQFRRAPPGAPTQVVVAGTRSETYRSGESKVGYRRGMSSRVVYDDQYGDVQNQAGVTSTPGVTDIMTASGAFFRALTAAVYLHAGADATFNFFKDHVISRTLDISTLFTFTKPTRDLARLCDREGFERPVARLLSETGRLTRHPVFVVGVFSGKDELGQGAAPSLNEARYRAAISALKGWYLYSPPGELVVPSQAEKEAARGKHWQPIHVDCGEVVV